MQVDNRLNIDVAISVHQAAEVGKDAVLFKVTGLNTKKIANRQIGAILHNPEESNTRFSTVVDNADLEDVVQIKDYIYEMGREYKRSRFDRIVKLTCDKYPSITSKNWEELKDLLHKQPKKLLVSNMTLRIKVTMIHVVPEQDGLANIPGLYMNRYNKREGYYSSNAQIVEVNIPLLAKDEIDEALNYMLDKLRVVAPSANVADRRESIADYVKPAKQKYVIKPKNNNMFESLGEDVVVGTDEEHYNPNKELLSDNSTTLGFD